MQSLFSAKTASKMNGKMEEWESMLEKEEHANLEKCSLCWRKACVCSSYGSSVVPVSTQCGDSFTLWRGPQRLFRTEHYCSNSTGSHGLSLGPSSFSSVCSSLFSSSYPHTLIFALISHWVSWFPSILSLFLTPIFQLAPTPILSKNMGKAS